MNETRQKRAGGLSVQTLIACALCSEFAYIGIAATRDVGKNLPTLLLFFGIAFGLYWLCAHVFFDVSGVSVTARNKWYIQMQKSKHLRWLHEFLYRDRNYRKPTMREILTIGILFGIIFRITILFMPPLLSDDVYRYIWDGKVAANDINPYLYAPDAPELEPLRDQQIYPNVNHKEIPTVYPPVSQMAFRALHWFSGSVQGFKIGFMLLDILTALGLLLILRELGQDIKRMLLYFWNPLLIIEITGNAHADIIGILFLTFAMFYLVKRRFLAGTAILVLSFLTKFIALFMLPVATFLKKENKLVIPLSFLILVAAFYLPYAEAGPQLLAGLSTYAAKWQFNGSIFALLCSALEKVLPEQLITQWFILPQGMSPTAETLITRTADAAILIAKIIVAIAFAAIMLYFLRRLKDDIEKHGTGWLFTLGVILFGSFIALNPTVHPWYLCWLLPFLAVKPNRAWLLLTGLSVLSYWILSEYSNSGAWRESLFLRMVEYLPFYSILIIDFVRKRITVRNRSAVRLGSA